MTYFHDGDDVTHTGSDAVTRQRLETQRSSWLQLVMEFVDKLLHSNRINTRYLHQTFTLMRQLLTTRVGIGNYSIYTVCAC